MMRGVGLAALALASIAASILMQAQHHETFGPARREGSQLHDLQYIQQTIFVRTKVTGPVGASIETDFIIDTGSAESTIDLSIARSLGLKAQPAGVRNITSTGLTYRSAYLLPKVAAYTNAW